MFPPHPDPLPTATFPPRLKSIVGRGRKTGFADVVGHTDAGGSCRVTYSRANLMIQDTQGLQHGYQYQLA